MISIAREPPTCGEFDADEVARLETAMWRSYYEKQRLRLFNQLSELLRTQYHMPLIRSNQVAYYAANAAFVFKDGKERADYEKAFAIRRQRTATLRKTTGRESTSCCESHGARWRKL